MRNSHKPRDPPNPAHPEPVGGSKVEGIRHLPDFLKNGDRELGLGRRAKAPVRAPAPIGGNGDPGLTYAWWEWTRPVNGGEEGGDAVPLTYTSVSHI